MVVGAVFAFLEILLTFVTGEIPGDDVWVLLGFDVVLWMLVAMMVAVARGMAGPARGFDTKDLGQWEVTGTLLIAPVLLFGMRGDFGGTDLSHRWWAPGLQVALTASLIAGLGLHLVRQHRAGRPFGTRQLLAWAVLSQAFAAAGLALRSVDPDRLLMRAATLASALGIYASTLVGVSWWGRRGQIAGDRVGRLTVATLLVSGAGALLVAQGWGIQPMRDLPPRAGGPRPRGSDAPSVLLITLDTVRRDHVSSYGYSRRTTPRLDDMAAHAVVFENAYATSPYTLASHASMFSGRLPSDHGAHPVPYTMTPGLKALRGRRLDFPLDPRVETLAARLSDRGYGTAAIVANTVYLAPWTGLARGFRHFDSRASRIYRFVPLVVPLFLRVSPDMYRRVQAVRFRSAAAITNLALAWLDHHEPAPFFLFLNYLDAHSPYEPPAPYDRLFPAGASAERTSIHSMEAEVTSGIRQLRPGQRDFLIAQYDGGIAFADSQVGRLLDRLRRERLLDGMLVIVTSDHGEFFGEHGLVLHGNALYEEVLRVPLIVKLPGQTEGLRVQNRVSVRQVWDIVWKVLDERASPRDLMSMQEQSRVVAEHWFRRRLHELNPDRFHSPVSRAVYDGNWKIIEATTAPHELYDLESDPGERLNGLLEPSLRLPTRAQRLTAGLPPLADALGTLPGPQGDLELVQQLRSLGYVN